MKKFDFFKTEDGVIAEIVYGEKKCCENVKIKKIEEQYEDATKEKHVPYIEEKENGYLVKVGKEVAHPMLEKHYITMIELIIDGDKVYRKYLKSGDVPEYFFEVPKGRELKAREYCNLHGLWSSIK